MATAGFWLAICIYPIVLGVVVFVVFVGSPDIRDICITNPLLIITSAEFERK
jgi:hypothetical protein